MVPDIDLQLQAAIKALTDTVMPAVDPGDKMAVEQLGLAIATLGIVRQHLPLARRLARRALAHAVGMAAELASVGGENAAALVSPIAAAEAALADPEADVADIDGARGILNEAICAVVDGASDGPAARAVEAVVIRRSRETTELARAWCLPAGFEPYPERLPSIESLLR